MTRARRNRGVTTVEWVIVAMIIGVGCIAVFRTFKDVYMQPTAERMGDCIEAAAGDGNLCGGLGSSGPSSGGGGSGVAGNGATASNGTGGNGATAGSGVGGNGAGGGMSAGELADSVGGGGAAGGTVVAGNEPGHGGGAPGHEGSGNPNAETATRVGWGMGLAQAAEDAAIEAAKKASGVEIPKGMERAIGIARAGEGAIVGVPLDIIANGLPHDAANARALAAKTAMVAAAGYFGGPIGGVAAVGLDKSLGYLADSMTGGNRYAADYEDSIAWHMVHGVPGTAGKEGLENYQRLQQQQLHEQLDYMHQQQQRDAEALREMMPH